MDQIGEGNPDDLDGRYTKTEVGSVMTSAPYQVHLLSVSQSQKQFANNLADAGQDHPNQIKLRQERIIQTIKSVKKVGPD